MSVFEPPKDNRASVALKDTEKTLLDAASRIVAARISAGEISGEVTPSHMKEAIVTAVKMGKMVDRMVHADNEI